MTSHTDRYKELGLEPFTGLLPQETERQFEFVETEPRDADENFYGYHPGTVLAIHDAIAREDATPDRGEPTDEDRASHRRSIEERDAYRRDQEIRAAAEEEMVFFNGYAIQMIVSLVAESKRNPSLAVVLKNYEYATNLAHEMHVAHGAGRDFIDVLGSKRLARKDASQGTMHRVF